MEEWKYRFAKDGSLSVGQRLRSVQREPGLISVCLHYLWCWIVDAYLAAAHRVRVIGRENLPGGGPFVLCANHSSHLDAFALAHVLPLRLRGKCFPIAASDTFFESPWVSAFACFAINALPMVRSGGVRHALEDLRSRLEEEGDIFILFPEGTRSRSGSMGRMKAGIGMLVAETPVPVIPCHIEGAFDALPPGHKIPRFVPIRVAVGSPLSFEGTPNHRVGWQVVTERLQAAIVSLQRIA